MRKNDREVVNVAMYTIKAGDTFSLPALHEFWSAPFSGVDTGKRLVGRHFFKRLCSKILMTNILAVTIERLFL